MNKTLVLNSSQQNTLQQIYDELLFSLKKTLTEEDLFRLSWEISRECGVQTFKSKKDKTVQTFKGLGRLSGKAFGASKKHFNNYRKNGAETQFSADLENLHRSLKSSPGQLKSLSQKCSTKISSFNDNFLKKSRNEKLEMLSSGILAILIFYASAGGEDFEGGIPDLDLELGIGYHRNVVSHSIISGLIIEFLMRSGVEMVNKSYGHLPENHHAFWDHCNKFINGNKNLAIGSMWAGISVHLIQDAALTQASTKPYTGIPFEMSMGDHQGLFAANGTASAMFARK